jgi:hypothetical protein
MKKLETWNEWIRFKHKIIFSVEQIENNKGTISSCNYYIEA